MRRPSFDLIDYKILQELQIDARKPAAEIARKLGINERTVRNRIDRMVEAGAVRLTCIVDPAYFGYVITADIFLEVDLEREQAVINALLAMPEVSYLAFGQGTQDLSIEVRFKNNEQLREFLRSVLPAIPGVHVKGYALVPRILRNIDEWMPPAEDFTEE
ncbi:MAG: Lrp/AsnC family transcriptional regulator [Thermanaerothrix sp.]|nr:Lrp/AsnC family transcriptional regulator [Thermanaerothrix sp.]